MSATRSTSSLLRRQMWKTSVSTGSDGAVSGDLIYPPGSNPGRYLPRFNVFLFSFYSMILSVRVGCDVFLRRMIHAGCNDNKHRIASNLVDVVFCWMVNRSCLLFVYDVSSYPGYSPESNSFLSSPCQFPWTIQTQ